MEEKGVNQRIFQRKNIEKCLPKKIAANWIAAMDGREAVNPKYLDHIAKALKDWALSHKATHYTHWFQPLRSNSAEKHEAFLTRRGWPGEMIQFFSGKDLMRGEVDASSFPSGCLRSTAAGRGYTIWDETSEPFLWENSDGLTLCLPAFFVSWTGEAIDYKLPLIRSEQKLEKAVLRLLKLARIPARRAFSLLGAEQEYFVVDRSLHDLRSDLVMCGRTVFGESPAKGQQLQDHYYASLDERVLAFMRDFEDAAIQMGIPIKTRHNEVAPAQYEMSPLFEKTAIAADHNTMLMELMRQIALQHDLVCLFHEKPFNGLNGSGKHCNWSIATDAGINLLDPKTNSFTFITLLTAILRAVHEHAGLLRASIGSAQNDWRLGGHEAPPSILSVYLGQDLEKMIQTIVHKRKSSAEIKWQIDLGLDHILPIEPEGSDRNRTSFFAFNSNRFEFRAVGSMQNVSWPMTVIHAIVADSLNLICDELEDVFAKKRGADLLERALPILKEHLKSAEKVLFSGDNYDPAWSEEAKKRQLPIFAKSFHAFHLLHEGKTERAFQSVLSIDELRAREEICYEQYASQMQIECQLMIDIFRTQILPAALRYQKRWAQSIQQVRSLNIPESKQMKGLELFSEEINQAISAIDELERIVKQTQGLGYEAQARVYCELALPRMEQSRQAVDRLEGVVDDALWPLPKYRELLYLR